MKKEITKEQVLESWRTLQTIGKAEMTFTIYRDTELGGYNKIEYIKEIIKDSSFNEKDGKQISRTFERFYNQLPKVWYNEGNPNNGNFLFDNIILHNDDYIFIQGHCLQSSKLSETQENFVKSLVNEYGKEIKADVHEFTIESSMYGLTEYTIKFWWD